jgi:hypothetical protein
MERAGAGFVSQTVRRRRRELRLTQSDGEPDVSRSTVARAEGEGVLPTQAVTASAFAAMLGWESDACDRLRRGEEPVPLPGTPGGPEAVLTDAAELRALAMGALRLLDVLVHRLPE